MGEGFGNFECGYNSCNKNSKVEQAIGRLQALPIDVNGVAHCLERIKANADRQNDIECDRSYIYSQEPKKGGQAFSEEVEVFEDT